MKYLMALVLFLIGTQTALAQTPSKAALLAETLAVTDGITTYIGIKNDNIVEANPIMPSSKEGIIGVTLAKVLFIAATDKYASDKTKENSMPVVSAVFGAATVNNLALINGQENGTARTLGVLSGIGFYYLGKHLINKDSMVYVTGDSIVYQRRF